MVTNSLAGYIDDFASLDGYGTLVDAVLELVPDLVWPLSVRTYSRMRHDPQITAILNVYTLAIRRARWTVDGNGCSDRVTAFIADELGLPVEGADDKQTGARRRGFTWAEHLRVSLLDLLYGHMFFEQSWTQTNGQFHLSMVQERMPQTLAALHLNSDGTLASVEQARRVGDVSQGPKITTADNRLVYYVNEREGANYFGRSLIRACYAPWLIKDQMLRVHATSIRKFGMGTPTAQALPGSTPTPQQLVEAQRVVSTLRASENAGTAMPPGFELKLTGLTGSVPDALAFITYLDRQMTRSTLTSLLDMATAERGSRALGETVMDLMVYAQQAVAQSHADVGTAQIVVPLVNANFGEDEPAPRICVGDVGADLELTANDIYWLTAYSALTSDPELESFIRGRYGIPDIDAAYIREPSAAPIPPSGGPASDG